MCGSIFAIGIIFAFYIVCSKIWKHIHAIHNNQDQEALFFLVAGMTGFIILPVCFFCSSF